MPGKDIPPIKWGTFHDEAGVAHVAPVIEGYLMKGHILSMDCKCGPVLNRFPNKVVIVHEVVH